MTQLCKQKNCTDTQIKMMMMIRNEWRAYKNIAIENGVYSTIYTMHNEYYIKQLTQNFKPA